MSAVGHKRTHALHKFFCLTRSPRGAAEQRCRDLYAELPCRLEIYYQFELGRLHDLQLRGLFALQDPADIDTCLPPCLRQIGAVADKAAGNKAST